MLTKISVAFIAGYVCLLLGPLSSAQAEGSTFPSTNIPIPNHSFEDGSFNGSFEVSPGMNPNETAVIDGQQWPAANDGRYYAKLSRGTGDAYVTTEWIETGADVTGKAFTVTFDIKSHSAETPVGNLLLQRFPSGDDWSDTGAYTGVITATTNWQTKTATLTFGRPRNGNTSSKIRLVLRPTHESAPYIQPIYYDNLRLAEGPFNLTCGTSCVANTQCADGLSCYQPMTYTDPAWQEVTDTFADVGTGAITSHDIYITPQGTKIESIVNNGVLFSRYGDDQPWRVIDFKCIGEATAATCCEMEGVCGLAATVNPNDTLLSFNISEASSSAVTIHITRQITGVYVKTMQATDLDGLFVIKIRESQGWAKQTEVAGLHTLSGENYLSFSMAHDKKGNSTQHLVKYEFSDIPVVYVFRRYNWLNRGWSEWTTVYDSKLKDIKRDFGDTLPGNYPISVDPYFSNGQHHNYLIRGTITKTNELYKVTDTHLYTIDQAKVSYAAGQCRGVFAPSYACDSTIASPSNLKVEFACSLKQANISWTKAVSGSIPNVYEISMCEAGTCTTDEAWNSHIIGSFKHNQAAEFLHTGFNYIKGNQYDFRIRSAYFEGDTRTRASVWSEVLTKTMAGPLGDMDADCDVDLTDYTTYLNAIRSPYAPESLFVRMIYFFNSLIANLGTSN